MDDDSTDDQLESEEGTLLRLKKLTMEKEHVRKQKHSRRVSVVLDTSPLDGSRPRDNNGRSKSSAEKHDSDKLSLGSILKEPSRRRVSIHDLHLSVHGSAVSMPEENPPDQISEQDLEEDISIRIAERRKAKEEEERQQQELMQELLLQEQRMRDEAVKEAAADSADVNVETVENEEKARKNHFSAQTAAEIAEQSKRTMKTWHRIEGGGEEKLKRFAAILHTSSASQALSRETALVHTWCKSVKAYMKAKNANIISQDQYEIDAINTKTDDIILQREIAIMSRDASAAIVSKSQRTEVNERAHKLRMYRELDILKLSNKSKEELAEVLYNRCSRREDEKDAIFSEGISVATRFGETISSEVRNLLTEQRDTTLMNNIDEAIKIGLLKERIEAVNFLTRIQLNEMNFDSVLEIGNNGLSVQYKEDAAASDSPWGCCVASDGPWSVRISTYFLLLEMLQAAYSKVESVISGEKYLSDVSLLKKLTSLLDVVHPTHSLHATVLSSKQWRQVLQNHLIQLGYTFSEHIFDESTNNKPCDPKEVAVMMESVLDQMITNVGNTGRYFYEVSIENAKSPINDDVINEPFQFCIGWTTYPFGLRSEYRIGSDEWSFGIDENGSLWTAGESYNYTSSITEVQSVGCLVDLYHGNLEIYIDGHFHGVAFGNSATHYSKEERDRQSGLLRTRNVIPAFSLLWRRRPTASQNTKKRSISQVARFVSHSNASGIGFGSDKKSSVITQSNPSNRLLSSGYTTQPTPVVSKPLMIPFTSYAFRINFGDESFRSIPKTATPLNACLQQAFGSRQLQQTVASVQPVKAISKKYFKTLQRTQFMSMLQGDKPKSFSTFPPNIYRRAIAVDTIVRAWRRYKGQQYMRGVRKDQAQAVNLIQRVVRRKLPRIRAKKDRAARVIQKNWRRVVFMRHALLCGKYKTTIPHLHEAAKVLQRMWRGFLALKYSPLVQAYRKQQELNLQAAIDIQMWWRAVVRGAQDRRMIRKLHDAANNIQRVFRGHRLRKLLRPDLRQRLKVLGASIAKHRMELYRHRAAYRIQGAWRSFRYRQVRKLRKETRKKAAIRIQAIWQGFWVRSNISVMFDYGQALFLVAVANRLCNCHFLLNQYQPCGIVCPR